MNKDHTSDLKIVQRFIFESSLYILNMFEKKIESFTQVKSKQARLKEKQYMEKPRIIGADQYYIQKDPIANIAKDLTKPIWNCITKVDPRVVLFEDTEDQEIPILSLYNRLFRMFIERFKNQHEDESNLNIDLMMLNKLQSSISPVSVVNRSKPKQNLKKYDDDLFKMLKSHVEKQLESLKQPQEMDMETYENMFAEVQRTLQASNQILTCMLKNRDPKLTNELNLFNHIIIENLNDVLDSKIGSLAICLQPKLAYLPLIIHPLLIGINHCLKMQINEYLVKQEKRKKQMQDQGKQNWDSQQNQMIEEVTYVYPTLKTALCSKIAFINLDGFQSEFNIDLAKHLSKYLLYVSFPKQSTNKMESNNLRKFEDFNSKRLLQKYLHTGMTEVQKKQALNYFQSDEKQQKKNMLIFPIHSRELSESFELPNVEFYQSTFIKFMMTQIVFNQIRQLNPSMIVLSYSPKTKLTNEHFTDIIRQLTILGNYRVVMYPNLGKMYSFEQQTPSEMIETSQYVEQSKAYYQKYEEAINIVDTGSRINTEFLDKISIFLKVSSGTFNLSKQPQIDSYTEKFKNYKIMTYAGLLIKIIGKSYPVMQRLKMRANEYLTISKVLANMYSSKTETFEKLFEKVLTKFHYGLLKTVEKKFFSEDQNPQNEYPELLQKINRKFDYVKKKDFWQSFKFEYCLTKTTEKTESKLYAYIPRFSQINKDQAKSVNNLVALQFDVLIDNHKIAMQFTRDTKFYYTSKRKHKNALIYAINHLPYKQTTTYCNYFGFINDKVDNTAESKVIFRPMTFEMKKNIAFTSTFCQFNYFETNQFIFMFWPQIFDCQQELLSKMAGVKYIPKITNFIFQAKRSDPGVFSLVNISNANIYADILPRYGCTCYQSKVDQQFYIFGGFYNNQHNYLSFQTDITVCKFKEGCLFVENIPKSFYFELESEKSTNQTNRSVKRIYNDLIRPKIEYQILQPKQYNQGDEKVIFLLGGVGQKFTRPYSMIGYMAQKLTFKNNDLASIRRIKTNNLYPVPVKGPIKTRCPNQMLAIQNNQKRNINTAMKHIPQNTDTYSHNSYWYDPIQEKLQYETDFQFADLSNKAHREQVSSLKKSISEYPLKYQLRAKCYRGKQLYTNFVTIKSQSDKKYVQQLQLEVSSEARQVFPTLPSCVRLTGSSIIAIDINASTIFALIKDPMITLNKCILAYYDFTQFSMAKNSEIRLKQIYQFDQDVSMNILVAANQFNIAILHGYKFGNNVNVPELIVKRRQNQIRTIHVKPCNDFHLLKTFPKLFPLNLQSTSLFLNQTNGLIFCFSFHSLEMIKYGERHYITIQQLKLAESQIAWEKKLEKFYDFIILNQQGHFFDENQPKNRQREGLKIIQIKQKNYKQKAQKGSYELVGMYCEQCYCGVLKQESDSVELRPMETSVSEYYKKYYRDNIRHNSIRLDKTVYSYEENNKQCMQIDVQEQNKML